MPTVSLFLWPLSLRSQNENLAYRNYPLAASMMIRQQIGGFPLSRSPEGLAPLLQKEGQVMLKTNSDFENKGIERILELSADAHIRRRGTIVGSPEFHNLTGAIAAYGRTLALLTGLQQWEAFRGNDRAA